MNFPSSPTLNQTYTFEGKTWKWNGTGWQLVLADSISWDKVSGKPAEFTPIEHDHAIADVTGLQTALNNKAASTHYHDQTDITGLVGALSGKANVSHTHVKADVGLGNVDNTSDATKQASFLSAIRDGVASAYDTLAKIVTEFTAALNTKAPSASPTLTGSIYANGPLQHNVVAVGAGTTIDCALGTYFTKSMSGAWTPTISNVPASRAFGFVVELAWTAGALTLPSGWAWAGGTAPTLSTGTWILTWITSDSGTSGLVVAQKRGA